MKRATTLLMVCVGALLSLGLVMLYSVGMQQKGAGYLLRQLIWAMAGLGVCCVLATTDYKNLKQWRWVFLGGALVLLGLVLVPGVGALRNGARRWFAFGTVLFQPSEAAKMALIIFLAYYGERYQRHSQTFWKGLAIPGLMAGLILGLIFVEPDRGTTILLASVTGVMLVLAGVRWLYIVPPALLAVAALAYSFSNDAMRSTRIESWLNLEQHKSGVGYQAWQAMLALGAGGTTGLGLGNGRQKLGFVPEDQTDFILSIIGEEMGLVATLGVVLAFGLFTVCGGYIASRARTKFGMLLASGITFMIGLQAVINIGVVTSALPNKGLPLPFISYGGSNLLLVLTSVGLLLSIAREAESDEFGFSSFEEGEESA